MLEENLPDLANLADAFVIPLSQCSLISLSGEERVKYLQGQVTCDVESLVEKSLLNGAHCNAKGKVHSTFRLFANEDKLLLLQSNAATNASAAELKKFGVFSKVDIAIEDSLIVHALAGEAIEAVLVKHFSQLPDALSPVIHENDASLLYLPGQSARYVLVSKRNNPHSLIQDKGLTPYPSQVWDLLEITNGIPALQDSGIGEYVPQMLNVQAINGISFTKGCYLGQETVARMQYLGKNKRALYCLKGQTTDELPTIIAVEKQLGENWRKAGDIICQYQSESGEIFAQAVLASDIDNDTKLRIKDHESTTLTVVDLPYNLSTQD